MRNAMEFRVGLDVDVSRGTLAFAQAARLSGIPPMTERQSEPEPTMILSIPATPRTCGGVLVALLER
jgi:hypothetical protein